MKRNLTLWLLLAVMLISALTSFASASTTSNERTLVRVQMIGSFSMEDKTDSITGETIPGMHVIKEDFEAKHPDIELEFILMGWDDYVKKTQAMIMADEADVFQLPGISLMADQGVLEPLASYIERDNFDLNIYLDGQVDGWRVQGVGDTEPEIYALPMLADTRVICYDKQIFDQWGVPYLSENPTLEEIMETAKQMTGVNPVTGEQNYGVMWRGTDTDDTIVNIAEGLGGTWGSGNRFSELTYNFNSEEMVEATEFLRSLLDYAPEGIMSNAGGENFGRENNNVAIHIRMQADNYMIINALGLSERYGISYLFVNPEYGKGGMFAGSPIGIGVNSKVKDAAWEYLKYTSEDTFQQYIMSAYQLPCVKNALTYENVSGVETMEMLLDSAQYLWTPRYPYRSTNPRSILSAAIESAMNGSLSAQEALDQAQADCERWTEEQA